MKKLHKLILSSFLGPFILTFGITLFILVMQFLWKYIDDIVGKDIDFVILLELLFYATANLVPMALPLAILLSSIMTFGNLGEHYELVALKSSGLSLRRIMMPLILFVFMLSGGAFYFSNNIWPIANLEFARLLYDIRHKKPTMDIQDGVYYKGIENYVIRIGKKEKDGKTLTDVTIYDHKEGNGNTKVVKAESGKMEFSADDAYLNFHLFNGYSYNEMTQSLDGKKKVKSNPLIRNKFSEQIIRFPLDGFEMGHADKELFSDNYQMLSISQLQTTIDTLREKMKFRQVTYADFIQNKFQVYRDSIPSQALTLSASDTAITYQSPLDFYPKKRKASILVTALNQARGSKTYVTAYKKEIKNRYRNIDRHYIELHRKFILSFACILLFFIGAPLGAIIRKGGLGMPVVISVFFFLLYHILSITGEKLVKQGKLEPHMGMWMASFILIPIGVFITYKATTDSPLFQFDAYSSFFNKWKAKLSKSSKT